MNLIQNKKVQIKNMKNLQQISWQMLMNNQWNRMIRNWVFISCLLVVSNRRWSTYLLLLLHISHNSFNKYRILTLLKNRNHRDKANLKENYMVCQEEEVGWVSKQTHIIIHKVVKILTRLETPKIQI